MNDWEHYKDNVWVCRVDNGVFGNYNPYTTMVGGDWYFAPVVRHTGAVYLNDRQLYEAETLEECIKGEVLCAVLGAGVVGLQMVYRAGQREKSDGHLRKLPG